MNIANDNENLFDLIITNVDCLTIKNIDGISKRSILISKDKLFLIKETIKLLTIPIDINCINKIRRNENWDKAKEYNPLEKW